MTRSSPSPAGTPALAALVRAGVDHTVHSYVHDPRADSYGTEAAAALGLDPARVLKTLVVDVDGALHLGIVTVDRQLDLKALARAVGGRRAAIADPRRAQRATGYVLGGISPLGQRRQHVTVVDDGATEHPTVFVSAGRRGLEVELTPADLVRLTDAAVAPIGR